MMELRVVSTCEACKGMGSKDLEPWCFACDGDGVTSRRATAADLGAALATAPWADARPPCDACGGELAETHHPADSELDMPECWTYRCLNPECGREWGNNGEWTQRMTFATHPMTMALVASLREPPPPAALRDAVFAMLWDAEPGLRTVSRRRVPSDSWWVTGEARVTTDMDDHRRRLVRRFLELPFRHQFAIALHLNVLTDDDRGDLSAQQVFERAAGKNLVAQLWRETERRHPDPAQYNPFEDNPNPRIAGSGWCDSLDEALLRLVRSPS